MESAQVTKVLQEQIVRWADIIRAADIRIGGQ
jgi:hypothetical protein